MPELDADEPDEGDAEEPELELLLTATISESVTAVKLLAAF